MNFRFSDRVKDELLYWATVSAIALITGFVIGSLGFQGLTFMQRILGQ